MNICGFVGIRTSLSLDQLAAVVSSHMCAGIPFGGKNEYLRDEVPAIYSLEPYLGLRIVLYGSDDDFGLDLEQWEHAPEDTEWVDMSRYLVTMLNRIDGVHAFVRGNAA
jgi:hypothetical protein